MGARYELTHEQARCLDEVESSTLMNWLQSLGLAPEEVTRVGWQDGVATFTMLTRNADGTHFQRADGAVEFATHEVRFTVPVRPEWVRWEVL